MNNTIQKLWVGNYFQKAFSGEEKPRAIIVDLDGTLTNSDHREHLIDQGKYDEYFDLVGSDTLNEWCADLIKEYIATHKVILLTGRPERVREITVKWLDVYDVPFDLLFMRQPEEREQGFIYKQRVYETFLEPNFDVRMVLDNDPKICEMFRDLGIPALQYDQENDGSEEGKIQEICDDLVRLVECHHKGDTEGVINYHEQIDAALHSIVGKEGLTSEEKDR